jgi:hypothetical protein
LSCLFVFSFNFLRCLYMFPLISLIILKIILWNYMFGISTASLSLVSITVGLLTFGGVTLPYFFILLVFLHCSLHICQVGCLSQYHSEERK